MKSTSLLLHGLGADTRASVGNEPPLALLLEIEPPADDVPLPEVALPAVGDEPPPLLVAVSEESAPAGADGLEAGASFALALFEELSLPWHAVKAAVAMAARARAAPARTALSA
ncbi:hypothetical protein [Streptomyces sp. NPDC001165]|uniref:hypothetical protein n=1 Tax=Streptomyces sp. NPDC001165 TaxID=3364546 RepID=UPI003692C3F7